MAIFKVKRKKYVNGTDYDKDRDYSGEMALAKEKGDRALLSKLEEERNRKIDGENLPYRKTYDYIDIGTKIEEGIRNKISPEEMKELVDARRDKAYQNKQYDIYKNDEIQKRGLKYYYDATSGAGLEGEGRPKEKDSFGAKIQSLLNKITNAQSFEYNPETDPAYDALKAQMRAEGRRAQTDVLAEVQQQSGGRSSYAVSAAAQAANAYNSKLTEQIPRLYELAYQRYEKGLDADRKAFDLALRASEAEKNAYETGLKQFNTDREFARESYEADLEGYAQEDKRKYEAQIDTRDFEYKKETDEKKAEAEKAKEAKDLVLHYEKSGIDAPDKLLEDANMTEYADASRENSSIYRTKLDLDSIAKIKQLGRYSLGSGSFLDEINLDEEAEKLKYKNALKAGSTETTETKGTKLSSTSKTPEKTNTQTKPDAKTETKTETKTDTKSEAKAKTEKSALGLSGIKTVSDLKAAGVINNIRGNSIYVDGEYVILSTFMRGCQSGKFFGERESNGKITVHKKN